MYDVYSGRAFVQPSFGSVVAIAVECAYDCGVGARWVVRTVVGVVVVTPLVSIDGARVTGLANTL